MKLSQLRILDAVERERSFSRAARRLEISQPAVSQQMRKLQSDYGVKLFWRWGKSLEFSEIGRELVARARKILCLLEDMEAELKSAGELRSGNLAVGLSCHYFVMEILAGFMKAYPDIQVKARIGDSLDLLEDVLACRLDIAEVTGDAPDPRFHNFLYGRQQIILFIPKTHPWAAETSISVEQLHGRRMVSWHASSMTRRIFMSRLADLGIKPNIVLEIDSWETMRQAVIAGIGFGVVLEDEYTPDDRLVKIPLTGADLTAFQYFVCLPEFRELKAHRAFFEMAARISRLSPNGGGLKTGGAATSPN